MMTKVNLVDLILNDHKAFDDYKKENDSIEVIEADFSHESINDIDLTNIDFSGTTFQETNLINVKFVDCDLSGVDFSRSTLTECDFSGSILNGTNFNYATVDYCNFSDSDLAGANFCEADLSNSDFSTCENLESCRFDEGTVWPDNDKLPEDFDCTYNYDLSSLREEDDNQNETY